MQLVIWLLAAIVLVLLGVRKILPEELGVVIRFGSPVRHVRGPAFVMMAPFVDRLQRVPAGPFSVSLPPQSAITKDEIPVQLQASLDASVADPAKAAVVKDWRIHLMSKLQEIMKDRFEELDFDNLDTVFPGWISSVRNQLNAKAAEIGVRVTDLQISNLSPRSKPQ